MTDPAPPRPALERLPRGVLFSGTPLTPELRRALAHRLARLILPVYTLTVLAVAMATLATGLAWAEPARMVPTLCALAAAPVGFLIYRRYPRATVILLIASTMLGGTAGLAMMGMNAPVLYVGLMILPVVVPLWGVRGGLVITTVVAIGALVVAALETWGWLTPAALWPPFGLAAVVVIFMLCAIAFLAGTTNLLSSALFTANQEQQRAERARQAQIASDIAFKALFEQAASVMFLMDSDGTVLHMNRKARSLFGVGTVETVEGPITQASWWSDDQRALLQGAIRDAQEGATATVEVTHHADAERQIFSATVSPFRDESGSAVMLLLEMMDVSELMDTRQQLEHAQRLESLGQLAGGVAHDFNNMLGAIIVASDMLRLDPAIDRSEDNREYLRIIDGAADRASDLTRKLLAFGRKDRLASAEVHMETMLRDTCMLLERTLGRHIVVVADIKADGEVVLGDGSALEHAIVNLAVNARDAMPDGGTITISARAVDLDAAWCGSLAGPIEPGPCMHITVRDDGPGIPADILQRIFEPFFTTKAEGGGSGLGLAAVDGTVRSHSGGLAVYSELGKGTEFHIFLPLAAGLRQPQEVDAAAEVEVVLRGTVLVVEDEPLMRRSVAALLRDLGVTVRVAHDGETALRMLRSDGDVDLVLTDLVMPGLDGLTVAITLDRRMPDLPIVLMSGFTNTNVPSKLPSGRALPFLRKPFQRRELLDTLRSYTELAPLVVHTRREGA